MGPKLKAQYVKSKASLWFTGRNSLLHFIPFSAIVVVVGSFLHCLENFTDVNYEP